MDYQKFLNPLQNHQNSFLSQPANQMKGEDQSRVIMKFEEKRVLLSAIRDRRELLFGQMSAKMKPQVKHAVWEDVISTFRKHCPDATVELSANYVRGIFWQNLRKRTLGKRERAATDENVKFDELDDLVAEILGDKIRSEETNSPPSPPSNVLTNLLPFLNESFYNQCYQFNDSSQPANDFERALDSETGSPDALFEENMEAETSRQITADTKPDPIQMQRKRKTAVLSLARLAKIEAETKRIKAQTRLLELQYACQCKTNGLKAEKLADGRFAYIIADPSNFADISPLSPLHRRPRSNCSPAPND